jgi:glycosyltransferase involved in cell wall biosynthesis
VLPSLYEAFGIPLVEAMSSGCPIVTANRYATAELVEEAAVLVNPVDVESIAEGMSRVVSDQRLREQIIAAGRERAKDFSWQKCARETLGVLQGVGVRQMTYHGGLLDLGFTVA